MLLAAPLLLGACSARNDGAPAATSATSPPPPPSASASATAAAPEANDDFREAMRRLDYPTAYARLKALDADARERPEIRLATGRAALGAGDPAAAVTVLSGLEVKLPAVQDEIQRYRAQAALRAGPYLEAAKYFEASPKIADTLRAAEAYERAEQPKKARELLDRAIRQAERTHRRGDLTRAHRQRAALAEKTGDKAVAIGDHKWLAVDAHDRASMESYLRLGGRLTNEQRCEILSSSTTKANLEATLGALSALGEADATVAFHKAMALYKARDYPRAQAAFDAFLKKPHPLAAEAAYYAARTVARQGDTKTALTRYHNLAKTYPKSAWAERATFRFAELLALSGKHEAAAKGFSRYLARYDDAKAAGDARFQQAVAYLSAGKAKEARKLFGGLASDAHGWRNQSHAQHLQALAAHRAGDTKAAKALWEKIVREHPLTYPALAARARLMEAKLGAPPPIGPAPKAAYAPPMATLPPAVAILRGLGMDLEAERHLEDLEDSVAGSHPGRESETLCALYGQLAGASRRAQIANRAVSLDLLMRPPSDAERWAWQCIYPRPYHETVHAAEAEQKLPDDLVYAVMRQESFFRTTATSPVGARGLMQLMPYTAARAAEELGVSVEPEQVVRPDLNVRLGAFYLGKLLRTFNGHVAAVAAAYNAGPFAVRRWLEGGETETDLFVARIPYHETRTYVQRVLTNLARYRYLAGGVDAVPALPLQIPPPGEVGDDHY